MKTFSKELIEWLESKELVTTVDERYTLLVEAAPLKKLIDNFALNDILPRKTIKVPCLFVLGSYAYTICYNKNTISICFNAKKLDTFKIKKKGKESIVELTDELKRFINCAEHQIIEKVIENISEEIKRLQKNKRILTKILN